MLTAAQLERVAGRVNLRIARGSQLSNDLIFLIELRREGIDEIELGEAHEDGGTWYWHVLNMALVQYASGRVAVFEKYTPADDDSPPTYRLTERTV